MNRPSPAQRRQAKQLLAYEAGDGAGSDSYAVAAGRVHDKLHARLDPLLGAAGVEALLLRSAKVSTGEVARLGELGILTSSAQLREYLRVQEPAVAVETATALFATFLALLETFIGERLMTEVLRSAWPTLDETASKETEK